MQDHTNQIVKLLELVLTQAKSGLIKQITIEYEDQYGAKIVAGEPYRGKAEDVEPKHTTIN